MKSYPTKRKHLSNIYYQVASILMILGLFIETSYASTIRHTSPADSLISLHSSTEQIRQLPDSVVRIWAKLHNFELIPEERANQSDTPSLQLDTAQTIYKQSRYEKHKERAIKGWAKLIPNQASLQYAGSIGLISAGLGWHYGRGNHWETELLVGFLPRYHSENAKSTFTIKQRYVPWHIHLSSRWTLQPLTTGFFFNTISGDDFWKNQPDRYPKNYYGFSTKVRSNIFIGQRMRYNIPHSKRILHQAVCIYYEISTCDLYLVSKFVNKDYPWKETLSLAIGLRWEM